MGFLLADHGDPSGHNLDDPLTIDTDGRTICQAYTDEISLVAAGVYAHGGTPCETNRSFKPEDVVAVERPDGRVTDSPEPAPISVEHEVTDREATWNATSPPTSASKITRTEI